MRCQGQGHKMQSYAREAIDLLRSHEVVRDLFWCRRHLSWGTECLNIFCPLDRSRFGINTRKDVSGRVQRRETPLHRRKNKATVQRRRQKRQFFHAGALTIWTKKKKKKEKKKRKKGRKREEKEENGRKYSILLVFLLKMLILMYCTYIVRKRVREYVHIYIHKYIHT